MKTTILSFRAFIVRPASLALALFTAMAVVPAYAGAPGTCDLNNGIDDNIESDGGSTANGSFATACGFANHASGSGSTAIGRFNITDSGAAHATAVGFNNTASGVNSSAFGSGTIASGETAIALGGWNDTNNNGVLDGGEIGTRAEGNFSVAIGTDSQALAISATAIGSLNIADGDNATAIGRNNKANALDATAVGSTTVASAVSSTALGNNSVATATTATAVGSFNIASGSASTAIGNESKATGTQSTSVGSFNSATNFGASALGTGNTATGNTSVAVGYRSTAASGGSIAVGSWFDADEDGFEKLDLTEYTGASGSYAIAVGAGARVSAELSLAVGAGAFATADNAVALGARSTADRDNTVSVGSAGAERQIINVAAGTADTDAVNVAQLNTGVNFAIDQAANYTDMVVGLNNGVDPQEVKDYADLGDANTLNQAKDYADVGDAKTLTQANQHANAGDAKTLSSANTYTDSQIQQLTGFDASSFNGRLDAMERRFGQQDQRISRVGAMGLAASSMNAHAVAGGSGRGRLALGVGNQGGKQAVSVGYGVRMSRVTLSLGGAFSGSDKGATAGFGIDL